MSRLVALRSIFAQYCSESHPRSVALCVQVSSPEAADLQVDFLHGYHGDGYPFDGAGGAVGHAFFPSDPARAGGVHLDADEQWAFRQPGRTTLGQLLPNSKLQPDSDGTPP